MTKTVSTWGYCAGEARIFELPADKPQLPEGWYDSPARVPAADDSGRDDGGVQVAVSSPVPVAPPLPSVDEQEAEERRRAIEENVRLKERVAVLEARIVDLEEELTAPALPPLPETAEKPAMAEILARAEAAEDAGPELTPRKGKKK